MQQPTTALSPTPRCPLSREELAQRALGATVVFFTYGEPHRRRKGLVTFADVDTLHLLVSDDEGEELVPLLNCRVLNLRSTPVSCTRASLNVWQYGEDWMGFALTGLHHRNLELPALAQIQAAQRLSVNSNITSAHSLDCSIDHGD